MCLVYALLVSSVDGCFLLCIVGVILFAFCIYAFFRFVGCEWVCGVGFDSDFDAPCLLLRVRVVS